MNRINIYTWNISVISDYCCCFHFDQILKMMCRIVNGFRNFFSQNWKAKEPQGKTRIFAKIKRHKTFLVFMFFEGSKPTMNISDVTSSCMTSTGVPCVQKRFEEGHVSSLVKAPKKLVLLISKRLVFISPFIFT